MNRRWLLGGVAALGGCSLLPQAPYVQKRDWPLDVRRDAALPPRRGGRILLVRNVQAAPGLEQRGLQWLQRDGSLHVDFYEQWAVPPAEAVADDLRRWLADAGLFGAVVAAGSRLNADFVLEGEVNTFMADLRTDTARASLAIVLYDQRPNPTRLLLQKTESAEVKLAGTDAPALAEGMKAALVEVLRRTEQEVAGATR
jgi:cholesterol transport system auxiliary component